MGYREVTLQISDENFAFAQQKAAREGYFGPEDCLNGILNNALGEDRQPSDGGEDNHRFIRLMAEKQALQEILIHLVRRSAECNLPHCDGECFQHIPDDVGAGYEDDIPF